MRGIIDAIDYLYMSVCTKYLYIGNETNAIETMKAKLKNYSCRCPYLLNVNYKTRNDDNGGSHGDGPLCSILS